MLRYSEELRCKIAKGVEWAIPLPLGIRYSEELRCKIAKGVEWAIPLPLGIRYSEELRCKQTDILPLRLLFDLNDTTFSQNSL